VQEQSVQAAASREKLTVPWYMDNIGQNVERVQTGVRIEKRLLKVLKAVADLHDITLGDLLEGIVLHAFEGEVPFDEQSLAKIAELKGVFGLDLTADDSHRLVEEIPS
jgi:hypothetical protein